MEEKLVSSNIVSTEHGFPAELDRVKSKFKKLTRNRVIQLISIHSYRLKWVLFLEIILLSGGVLIELFYPRWYLIVSLLFCIISLFIGIYGLYKKNIFMIQIFSLFQSLGLIFSLIGTILIYWFIMDYNTFCSSDVIENKQNCIPKIFFLITATFSPFMFILLLFGVIYGLKLARYHNYYLHFCKQQQSQSQQNINNSDNHNDNNNKQNNSSSSYAIITSDETGNINPILNMTQKKSIKSSLV